MSDDGIRSFRIEIPQAGRLGEMAQEIAGLFDDLARWCSIAATGANRAGRPFCQANQDIPAQAGE
jgi:hypothetical protein